MEVLALIGSLLLAFISGLFYGEKETIIRKKYQKLEARTWAQKFWFPPLLAEWWEANNYQYKNKWIDRLMRYVLAPFKDGYHFCGSVSVAQLILSVSLGYGTEGWVMYIIIISDFLLHGIGANTSYHDWIKEL